VSIGTECDVLGGVFGIDGPEAIGILKHGGSGIMWARRRAAIRGNPNGVRAAAGARRSGYDIGRYAIDCAVFRISDWNRRD